MHVRPIRGFKFESVMLQLHDSPHDAKAGPRLTRQTLLCYGRMARNPLGVIHPYLIRLRKDVPGGHLISGGISSPTYYRGFSDRREPGSPDCPFCFAFMRGRSGAEGNARAQLGGAPCCCVSACQCHRRRQASDPLSCVREACLRQRHFHMLLEKSTAKRKGLQVAAGAKLPCGTRTRIRNPNS